MGDIIRRKIITAVSAVIGIALLVTALLCFLQIKRLLDTPDINAVRTDMSLLISQLEKSGDYEADTCLPYAVIMNDGTVAYNGGTSLHDKVNLHSLNSMSDAYLTTSLMQNGTSFAMLYIEIPCEYYGRDTMAIALWVVIFVIITAISVLIWLTAVFTLRNDIFKPISQLHGATRDILNGRLDTAVKYDYDGETGMLCHDFELMRTELRDSFAREQKIKDDEKLLMASISHDLKTPLATVQGYLESICLGVITDEDEIKHCCKCAFDKTVLLGKLTNDILEHSKAELRQLSIMRTEVYTAQYFGELANALKSDAESRGFCLTYGEIPNMIISLDKTRIQQVVENIVGNSFKYGKANGNIELSFRDVNHYFIVSVKDDGQGIAAEDLPFVFNRFFRGDKARTQNVPGSGLGLTITKYIVELHGGQIECDSIQGHGTTIEFSIAE